MGTHVDPSGGRLGSRDRSGHEMQDSANMTHCGGKGDGRLSITRFSCCGRADQSFKMRGTLSANKGYDQLIVYLLPSLVVGWIGTAVNSEPMQCESITGIISFATLRYNFVRNKM